MEDKFDKFQLPAAFGRERLEEKGRVYQDLTVHSEIIDNFEAVRGVLDGTRIPEIEAGFETCFQELLKCTVNNRTVDFHKRYDVYRKDEKFLLALIERLRNQKIRYTFESDEPSLWTVVGWNEIILNPEDPVLDIQEVDTGKKHALFLFDVMRTLIAHKSPTFGKRVI